MEKVLILGATSTIARALASQLARRGAALFLAARDRQEVTRLASDLRLRHGAAVHCDGVEATDFSGHAALIDRADRALGGMDGVILAIGLLGSQPRDSHDVEAARRLIEVNLTAAVSLLSLAAGRMEERAQGTVVGLSSVAGDRGRRSNYVYGAAKGGLTLYLQGLRNRLSASGVEVYTIKLGVVDTSMTYGLKGLPPAAQPEAVAASILRATKRSPGEYYVPWFWRWIMLAIRSIPEQVFRRMKL